MIRGWPLLLFLGSCSGQPAIAPGGIVSNNPCIDAILAEIAAPHQIAAVSVYSHESASASAPVGWARQFPALGPAAEEIIAAKPRLVLTGNLASSGTNTALAKAGLDVVALGVASTLDEDIAQVRHIARAIGRIDTGKALVTRMKQSVSQTPNIPQRPTAIIWQNGGFVAGEGTMQDELLRRHGFRNASASFGLKSWGILPLETLIRNPPEVIFMPLNADGGEDRAMAARAQLINNIRNQTQIVHFPDKLLYCGGPTTIKVSNKLAKAREDILATQQRGTR